MNQSNAQTRVDALKSKRTQTPNANAPKLHSAPCNCRRNSTQMQFQCTCKCNSKRNCISMKFHALPLHPLQSKRTSILNAIRNASTCELSCNCVQMQLQPLQLHPNPNAAASKCDLTCTATRKQLHPNPNAADSSVGHGHHGGRLVAEVLVIEIQGPNGKRFHKIALASQRLTSPWRARSMRSI